MGLRALLGITRSFAQRKPANGPKTHASAPDRVHVAKRLDQEERKNLLSGRVSQITATLVKGWAYDPSAPAPVEMRATLDGKTLAVGVADLPRPSREPEFKTPVLRGYVLKFDAIKSDQIKQVQVAAKRHDTGEWVDLPRSKALVGLLQGERLPQRKRKSYQDFDGTGSSKSHRKLAALRLDKINKGDLTRMSVLDIGCNEGFFCLEALRRGASRVVGIDSNARWIESATQRVPEATFINQRWSELPHERFDLIFFLSAIHYEPDQKTLLRNILSRLNPGGTLILECGVAEVDEEKWFKTPGRRSWHTVMRKGGLRRYPTYDMLTRELLAGYSVRIAGRSIDQAGDPVPRWVLHCKPKMQTAIMIKAPARSGKTSLTFSLDCAGIPCYRIDPLLSHIVRKDRYSWSPVATHLRSVFDTTERLNLSKVAAAVVYQNLEDSLAHIIFEEIPREAEIFIIEGEALCHPSIMQALTARLIEKNIRPWIMQPADTSEGPTVSPESSEGLDSEEP